LPMSDDFMDLVGDQNPRLSHLPTMESGTVGPAAGALAEVAGLRLDDWQQWCVNRILGTRDETYLNDFSGKTMQKSSAYESGIVVARQNGKGAILEAVELAWLFMLDAKIIVHSAHEFATSREHFQRMEALISSVPELKAEVARGGIKWSHGDESINLKGRNGQPGARLLFKTRTKGAARGFSIDKLVMDEAMVLKPEAVAAMVNATSARPDAQIVFTGSAGDRDSEHFGRVRSRGLKGSDRRLFFAEWSADLCKDMCEKDCEEHDDRNDPQVWAKANPGLGVRINAENVLSDIGGQDEDIFNAERLSVGDWPVDGEAWKVISKEAWASRQDDQSTPVPGTFVFAVDTTPDMRYSCITVAASNGKDGVHVEITGDPDAPQARNRTDYRTGTKWVVPRIIQLHERYKRSTFVIDAGTQASQFIDDLEAAGVKVLQMNGREHAEACGAFYSSVVPVRDSDQPPPDLFHIGQAPLSTALAGAEKRKLSDRWAWDKNLDGADISPLVSATNALWGYRKSVTKKRPKPMAAWGR